jgi:hypothetical protein
MTISKTAQVLRFFAQQYGSAGITRKRLVKLAYMSDVLSRQYLGQPITELGYIKDHYGPNARELPEFTKELVEAALADEWETWDGNYRRIRLRAMAPGGMFSFSLGETEILAYVAKNYLAMDIEEFIDSVVKNTDPFKQVIVHGEHLPMHIVDNTVRNGVGFDLERVAAAERQAEEGDFVTLGDLANELHGRYPD